MKISVNQWPNFWGAIAAGLMVVAFCLVLHWHDPLVFWNDDYELSILPVFADIARSWSEGHFPLLSPYSWVCSNLAGEFQYGTFSVFVNAAVIFIWKFPLTFPQQASALSITHLFVLAAGAFLLARDRQLSTPLSIFVALVAALNGWIICWGATDWFGALGAFTWLPWSWRGLERALDRQRTRWRFLWPALFVYLLVTGGFPYTVVMLFLLIAWLSIKSLVQTKRIIFILPMLFGVALGLGISAPAWLALLDYIQGSAREVSNPAHFRWVVPPAALPGFILPCWTVGWVEFSPRHVAHTAIELACGLVAPIALVAGLIWGGRLLVKQMKWDLILLALVLALSMLPTAGLFQWSFRWLPFVHLVLAICAAEVLQLRLRLPTSAVAMLALIVITAAMLVFRGAAGVHGFPLTWIYLALATFWTVASITSRGAFTFREWAPAIVTSCALLATYFCLPINPAVPKFNLDQKLLEPAPLDPQRLYLSIYPSPESEYRIEKKPRPIGQVVRPGSTSMWAGLRFINGYSPIRPAGVANDFWSYVHGDFDPDVGNKLLKEQAGPEGTLALLGVDGIVVAREIDVEPQPASEWQLVVSADEGRVFHRRAPLARVRSMASIDSGNGEQFAVAKISGIDESRNRVQADIDVAPGDHSALLIFSRPYFRGYQAHLNGKKLSVESADGLCPVVRVPAGLSGRLKLEYWPGWLVYGGACAIFSAAIFLLGLIFAAAGTRNCFVPRR